MGELDGDVEDLDIRQVVESLVTESVRGRPNLRSRRRSRSRRRGPRGRNQMMTTTTTPPRRRRVLRGRGSVGLRGGGSQARGEEAQGGLAAQAREEGAGEAQISGEARGTEGRAAARARAQGQARAGAGAEAEGAREALGAPGRGARDGPVRLGAAPRQPARPGRGRQFGGLGRRTSRGGSRGTRGPAPRAG